MDEQTARRKESNLLAECRYAACALSLLVHIILIVFMSRCYRNFGRGLKEKGTVTILLRWCSFLHDRSFVSHILLFFPHSTVSDMFSCLSFVFSFSLLFFFIFQFHLIDYRCCQLLVWIHMERNHHFLTVPKSVSVSFSPFRYPAFRCIPVMYFPFSSVSEEKYSAEYSCPVGETQAHRRRERGMEYALPN